MAENEKSPRQHYMRYNIECQYFQRSLPKLMELCGLSISDLGRTIAAERGTINNWITGRNRMNRTSCLACMFVLERVAKKLPEEKQKAFIQFVKEQHKAAERHKKLVNQNDKGVL